MGELYFLESVRALFLCYFYMKVLRKEISLPFCFLSAVCDTVIAYFVPVSPAILFALSVLLFTAGGVWICHADVRSSFLYASLIFEIALLCYGVMESLLGFLYPLWPFADFETADHAIEQAGEITSLILTALCCFIVYRYFSGEALSSFDTAAEMKYVSLVIIPILMIFIMAEYINSFSYSFALIESDGYRRYLFSHGQLFIMYLLGLASLFCILFSYKRLLQSFRLKTELSLLEQEEDSLNRYVEEAKARYDRTKSFRHDIRNHINVIKQLLQSGKLEQAVSYIEDMDEMAEKMSFPCSTNHPVVDILLGNKLGIAKSMGIRADCALFLPYPCGLRDIDICIVLSNALDNAIRACRETDEGAEKYIGVSGRIQGDFLMLKIENSFRGKGAFQEGTGLANIKMVAEKYGGAMSIETQGDVFVLHVLLIIPEPAAQR
ncbi:MAG: GHKL domain-containing protein [Roseburia sp.]|jgi:hypothetical protein|nr:GHKL domain-containing protein [Roseburia sp.]